MWWKILDLEIMTTSMSLLSLVVSHWLVRWQESQHATKFANSKILCKFLWVVVKATGLSTLAHLAISIYKYFYTISFKLEVLVNVTYWLTRVSMCRQSLLPENIWLMIQEVAVKMIRLLTIADLMEVFGPGNYDNNFHVTSFFGSVTLTCSLTIISICNQIY